MKEIHQAFQNFEFTEKTEDDTIALSDLIGEEELMPTKFHNFHCIWLYAYIDSSAALTLADNAELNKPIQYLINTPIELYESAYMAEMFKTSGNRKLVAFAVCVEDIYDILDLQLEQKVTQAKNRNKHKTVEEIKNEAHVVRELRQYKEAGKKAKPYIVYIVQNQNAIKQICTLR